MNREIKFRGKRVDNDEWVYGSLIYDVNEKWYIHQNNFVFWAGYCEIIPETIGQYTGLKDKNGKEIYEGDILELKNSGGKETCVVYYDDYQLSLNIKWYPRGYVYDGLYNLKIVKEIEVTGNIYESEVTNVKD